MCEATVRTLLLSESLWRHFGFFGGRHFGGVGEECGDGRRFSWVSVAGLVGFGGAFGVKARKA